MWMLLPAKRCQEPMTVVGQDEFPLVGWLVGWWFGTMEFYDFPNSWDDDPI